MIGTNGIKRSRISWEQWGVGTWSRGMLLLKHRKRPHTRFSYSPVSRKEPRPTKPNPLGQGATIDRQLAYERLYQDAYSQKIREWKYKQLSSHSIIMASCQGLARKQVEKHRYGQIAYTVLRELFGPSTRQNSSQESTSLAFTSLCNIQWFEFEPFEDFGHRVERFAAITTDNSYTVPQWMQRHFFRIGLSLPPEKEAVLLMAEEEVWGTDLSIKEMIAILNKCRRKSEEFVLETMDWMD